MWTSDGHLDHDTLAEEAEGILPPADVAAVTAHLRSCSICQQARASVAEVARQLAALGGARMPGPVSDRLDASLEAAARGVGVAALTSVPSTGRRRGPSLAGLSAAAAAVALIAGITVGALELTGSKPAGVGSAPPGSVTAGAPTTFRLTDSGRAYTKANLGQLLPSLAGAPAAGSGGLSGLGSGSGSGSGSGPGSGSAPGGSAAGTAGPAQTRATLLLNRLRTDPAAMTACLDVLSAPLPIIEPLAVDLGTFGGVPAAIFVLPVSTHPQLVDVYVEGAECAAGHDATLYVARLPRPSGL
ncbi:MAG TPA: hypothetical protein VNG13_09890 [Mycobacteriales bacterium]|nr:hypothetical protein [Mycobacteriales bacterium]